MTTTGRTRPAPIAALRSCPSGRYADELVVVEPGPRRGISGRVGHDGRVHVAHRLRPSELDDDLATGLLAALEPLTDDHEVFARAFTGIVLTSNPQAMAAWELFYRNSLARLGDPAREGYGGVYRHALELLPTGTVLDLGCGIGFLALHLAARGTTVTACDVEPGTTALLRQMARRLRLALDVRLVEGTSVPMGTESVEAVALLHVLEHLDPHTGRALLAEALRVARDRVVVAVPYEPYPTALYGHVRRFGADDLIALGNDTGWAVEVHDHLGGWLVLDRRPVRRGHPSG